MANRNSKPKGWRGSVINMSMRAPDRSALRDAAVAAFMAGIPIVTTAGNNNSLTAQAPCMSVPFTYTVHAYPC
jgi:hypothetical protein